jgi:hypothetical protein
LTRSKSSLKNKQAFINDMLNKSIIHFFSLLTYKRGRHEHAF